jgi:hypothetical protein
MSGWIDIRVRKPTEADADKEWQEGKVLQLLDDNSVGLYAWGDRYRAVAWMPIPEFKPLPDPPAPTYRPFANAAEFEPHKGRWIYLLKDRSNQMLICSFSERGVWHAGKFTYWHEMLSQAAFSDDGTPFGVKVEE